MSPHESDPPQDYTSVKYWDERYAADETVYEWCVLYYQYYHVG